MPLSIFLEWNLFEISVQVNIIHIYITEALTSLVEHCGDAQTTPPSWCLETASLWYRKPRQACDWWLLPVIDGSWHIAVCIQNTIIHVFPQQFPIIWNAKMKTRGPWPHRSPEKEFLSINTFVHGNDHAITVKKKSLYPFWEWWMID